MYNRCWDFLLHVIVLLFICLNLQLNLQFISMLLFCLATSAVLNFDMNTTFLMAEVVKLISLNVKGLSNFKKRRTMFTWCRKRKADIFFCKKPIQQLKQINIIQWKNEWGAEIITSHGSSNARGVAILIKNGSDCTIHQKILDPLGRFIILKADIKDKAHVLINVYAPNKDKDLISFFSNFLATLQKENLVSEYNIIIGGDFNCPLNPEIDKKGGIIIQRKSVTACIDCLQSQLDLVDIWRIKNPDTRSFTWSQKSPRIFCHLDYWLICNNLNDLMKSCEAFNFGTDFLHWVKVCYKIYKAVS